MSESGMAESGGMASEEPGSLLEELEASKLREEDAKDFLVQRGLDLGDQAMEAADWEKAVHWYNEVLKLDPGNEQAREKLHKAGRTLGVRPSEVADALAEAEAEKMVRRQQAQAEISDLVRVAEQLEKEGDFEGAIRRYEKARLIVSLYPYEGDFVPNDEQLTNLVARATAAKVQAAKALEAKRNNEAREIAESQERKEREAKQARINALFNQARLAMDRMKYDSARAYAEEILRIDPTNKQATQLTNLARDAKLSLGESQVNRDIREQWQSLLEDLDKSAIPQVEPVLFPREWLQVQAKRSGYSFSRALGEGVDPKTREIENVLNATVVNINFEETPLRDAASFLGQYANVNIIVLPSVEEEKSEDELLVSLRVENITVASALTLIAQIKQLSWRIDKGVVQIGTEAQAIGKMILDLYDVKDLTVPIRSFPGEDINLVPSGGFGFGLFEEEEIEPIQAFEGESLADLIRETVDPGVWDEGGDVTFREGGILIAKAPVETHKKIRKLLDDLRASGGLVVTLETRFINAEDSFLQDIGVDIRGLGDQSGGLGARGKGTTVTFDDVLTGTPNAPAGIGTSNFAGVYYNLNSDGDVRGRVENLLDLALGRTGILTNAGGASIQATFIDDTELELVLRAVEKSSRATIVTAPKLMVYNHERANVTVLNQVSYIQDFDVEIAQAAQIGDPIVQTLRDGVILDVKPVVSADRKYVTLELRPTIAKLTRPIATFSTTLGNGPPVIIQLPEITIQRVRTTVTMPDGGILLIGGLKFLEEQKFESSVPWINKIPILSFFWSRKAKYLTRRSLLVLVKAKIIVLEEMAPRLGQ